MVTPSHPRVAIASAVRTPVGKYLGSLRSVPATTLGTLAARAAIERAHLSASDVEDVLMGQAILANAGQNPARQVGRGAGIPDSAGATTISMVCGSGMKSVHLAAAEIRSGEAKIVLAGGMESMSRAPYLLPPDLRWGTHFGDQVVVDAMQHDSLRDAYDDHELMGFTGERIAAKFHLGREEIDAYAVRSNHRAAESTRTGASRREIVEVPSAIVPGAPGLVTDECVRPETTLEGLAHLRPAFRPDGVLTAGNSSKLSDGAAALVLMAESEVIERGVPPLGWLHSSCVSGVHPSDVMESPIPTVRKHLAAVGLSIESFDRVEHNEAYASASLAFQRTFRIPDDRFNVLGGAVSIGHPIGASGARLLVTLTHQLAALNGHLGLATLCMGGGNGLSTILERDAS
ncbi:MAG: thiolase family protein [Thermoplasmata archaeon]